MRSCGSKWHHDVTDGLCLVVHLLLCVALAALGAVAVLGMAIHQSLFFMHNTYDSTLCHRVPTVTFSNRYSSYRTLPYIRDSGLSVNVGYLSGVGVEVQLVYTYWVYSAPGCPLAWYVHSFRGSINRLSNNLRRL